MKTQKTLKENRTKSVWKWAFVVFQVALVYLLLLLFIGVLTRLFLSEKSFIDWGSSLVVYASFLLWLPFLFLLVDRRCCRKFSLSGVLARLDLKRLNSKTVAWGLIIILATLQLIGLLASAFDWLGLVDSNQTQSLFNLMPRGGWGLFWFFVFVCLLAPITEEIVFRRWFFKPLDKRFGLWPALVVSSVVFGLVHFDLASPGAMIWTAIIGLVLAGVYRWSGNLWVVIIMHATINTLSLALHLLGY